MLFDPMTKSRLKLKFLVQSIMCIFTKFIYQRVTLQLLKNIMSLFSLKFEIKNELKKEKANFSSNTYENSPFSRKFYVYFIIFHLKVETVITILFQIVLSNNNICLENVHFKQTRLSCPLHVLFSRSICIRLANFAKNISFQKCMGICQK